MTGRRHQPAFEPGTPPDRARYDAIDDRIRSDEAIGLLTEAGPDLAYWCAFTVPCARKDWVMAQLDARLAFLGLVYTSLGWQRSGDLDDGLRHHSGLRLVGTLGHDTVPRLVVAAYGRDGHADRLAVPPLAHEGWGTAPRPTAPAPAASRRDDAFR